jgi:transposase InsO family protein
MTKTLSQSQRWAAFRFSVIGPLYAARPDHGELRPALEALSRQDFTHPITGARVRFGYSTLERWFYAATRDDDPLTELRRKVRKDAGTYKAVSLALREEIRQQYAAHPTWSYQLHYENLDAVVDKRPEAGPLPSYTTVRRYMRAQGYVRQKRRTDHRVHHSAREVRSYEMADAHALWHLDFHHGKRRVLLPSGEYQKPILLAIMDDHSRVCCHAQWYLGEGAEQLAHGLIQAFLKRGLPRAILMDNGAAMQAAEVTEGLLRLGILQRYTLSESPHQNGKQETFFAPIEGKCVAMLEGIRDLDLDLLNRATIAWVEQDYHRRHHEGIDTTPLDRLRTADSAARVAPAHASLRAAFRAEVARKQRRGDGTITVLGVRFEIPSRYRHLETVHVRVARWDLSRVTMVDPRHGTVLAELHPLDRHRNADGHRKVVDPARVLDTPPAESGMAPAMARLLERAEQSGLPPAYIPLPAPPADADTTQDRDHAPNNEDSDDQ